MVVLLSKGCYVILNYRLTRMMHFNIVMAMFPHWPVTLLFHLEGKREREIEKKQVQEDCILQ